jgi:hypothetical protein
MLYRVALAFALAVPAAALPALAETQEERQACTNDANNLCPDEIPDREKVYNCLVKKVNELSPLCKKVIVGSITPSRNRR